MSSSTSNAGPWTLDPASPGCIDEDLVHSPHTGGHRINHQGKRFIHHAPQTQLWRDQVTLIAVCLSHHLRCRHDSITLADLLFTQ